MKTIFQFPLASDISIKLLGKEVRKIPSLCRKEVDAVWEKEKREGFFDGTVLSIVRYTSSEIECELVSYKAFYATIKKKALRRILNIFPLGISGRTFFKNKVLIGTRGPNVSMYAGEKECVPSGAIDRLFIRKDFSVDLACGITTELCEESGIDPEYVERVMPRSLYWDWEGAVFDIHLDIFLKEDAPVDKLASPEGEYVDFMWVTKEDISTSLLEQCLPLSRTLLQLE